MIVDKTLYDRALHRNELTYEVEGADDREYSEEMRLSVRNTNTIQAQKWEVMS